MKFLSTNKLNVKIVLLALFFGWFIWVEFDRQESNLRAEQTQFLATQQTTWAQENARRALVAKQKSVDMEKIYSQKATKAFGGPVDAAVKDPALDIRHMLAHLAVAAAPAGTEVSVTIDRFTEFDTALVLQQPLSVQQMARITKIFLKNGAPYVHSLRFIYGNEVLAQLQAAAIDSVTSWDAASVDSVQALLLTSNTENEPGAAISDIGATQTDNSDLSPDQIKVNEVKSAFKIDSDEHVRRLQKVVTDLNQAAQLGSVQNRNQLIAQIAALDNLASRLATERYFFLHQSSDWEQLLNSQHLDPLLVTILKREMQNRNQEEAPLLSRLFDSISTYQDRIKAFLSAMETDWGEWTVEPGGRQIRFTTTGAQSTYSFQANSVRTSAEEVQANFRSWANQNPAK